MKDYNSTTNQSIKEKFVGIHVYAGVNMLVQSVIEANVDSFFEDVTNYWMYETEDGERITEDEKQERIDALETELDNATTEEAEEAIQEKIDTINDLEQEPAEILEWWIVSEYLADKLEEQGECIYDNGQNKIWGRCTSGQAILLDACISYVCEGMEILEGQTNEWTNS